MAIDIKTVICPQCGSTDVDMTSDTQGVCNSCGAKFTVQQRIETQNVYNEVHVHTEAEPVAEEEEPYNKAIITPEYSPDYFVRKAWIKLAEEDVPFEVFDQDFGEVSQTEHEVLVDRKSADMRYWASIGYDRQEPYIDYEDYYEDEPYIAYERQRNSVTNQYEERQVTKYRKVKKQRQVTKYRTVTDWSSQNGRHSAESFAFVENLPGRHLDEAAFMKSFQYVGKSAFAPPPAEKAAQMQVTDEAYQTAMDEHERNFSNALCRALPGDHYKDLDYEYTITKSVTALCACQEYEVTLSYNGKTYCKRAFPFGGLEIRGDRIVNEESLASITKRKEDSVFDMAWDKTKRLSWITIGALALSIIVSLAIRVTALVIIAFVIAAGLFVFNTLTEKKTTEAIYARVKAEINDYTNHYKTKQRELLDRKLTSLGYEPARADEL